MKIITFCLVAITLVFSAFTSSEALSDKKQTISSQYECKGTKTLCINGTVIKIIDGDTLFVKEIENGKKYKIRLSLISTPELYGKNHVQIKKGWDAKNFLNEICPSGSNVIVDQDDKQPFDKQKRVVGKVICSDIVLNSELLDNSHAKISKQHCSKSEFSEEAWAQKYGCEMKIQELNKCDPSYPDVCIAPYPPDLDCNQISYRNFRVLPPDSHRFDVDKDGMGCERN